MLQEWADRQNEQNQEKERLKAKSETSPPEIPTVKSVMSKEKTTKKQILAGLSQYQPDKPTFRF